jgi:hypothetical protein
MPRTAVLNNRSTQMPTVKQPPASAQLYTREPTSYSELCPIDRLPLKCSPDCRSEERKESIVTSAGEYPARDGDDVERSFGSSGKCLHGKWAGACSASPSKMRACGSGGKLATGGRAHPGRADCCQTARLIIDKSLQLGTGSGGRGRSSLRPKGKSPDSRGISKQKKGRRKERVTCRPF